MSSVSFWQIEDRELEVRSCKSLLHLNAEVPAWHQTSEDIKSSDSKQHVMLAEKREIAKSLEHNSTVSKLEMENLRLTEQLHRFYFVETISAYY